MIKWIIKIWRRLFGSKKLPDNENDFKVLQLAAKANLEIVKTTEVEKDKIAEERRVKSMAQIAREKREKYIAKFRNSGYKPPRSATAEEERLYAIKPNLQYWVNKGML